jgi:hypothetical protein
MMMMRHEQQDHGHCCCFVNNNVLLTLPSAAAAAHISYRWEGVHIVHVMSFFVPVYKSMSIYLPTHPSIYLSLKLTCEQITHSLTHSLTLLSDAR